MPTLGTDGVNDGTAANDADPDGDGIRNLLEYGFGLDPKSADEPSVLPVWTNTGMRMRWGFTPPAGSPVTYRAEWSTTMQEGDWHPGEELPAEPGMKRFRVRHDASGTWVARLFLCLRVSE